MRVSGELEVSQRKVFRDRSRITRVGPFACFVERNWAGGLAIFWLRAAVLQRAGDVQVFVLHFAYMQLLFDN